MGNCWGSHVVENNRDDDKGVISIRKKGGRNEEEAFNTDNDEGKIIISETPKLKKFSFEELKSATRNFRPNTVLGEGGFGMVYKGSIDEKMTYYSSSSSSSAATASSSNGNLINIAVKKLDNGILIAGLEELLSDVNFLGTLSHPNIVKLLGYCSKDQMLFLVHEFIHKGSLENNLFRRGSVVQLLSWSIRLKIAIGAAQGLAYLHNFEKQVIYREFNTSKILLDENFNAKLSDFGLPDREPAHDDVYSPTERHFNSQPVVYAAPEYVATGELYVESNVYGFGVVLLEMLTGQRAYDRNRPPGQHILVDWMKPFLSDRRKLGRVMDPRLEGQYPTKGASFAAQLVLKCLQADHGTRPSMNEVVETLKKIGSQE